MLMRPCRPILSTVLGAALLTTLLIAVASGCGGSGVKLIVGNIEGPSIIGERNAVEFAVQVSGDTGITYMWTCDPPLIGAFSAPTSAVTGYTSIELAESMVIQIKVVVSSDSIGPIIREKDVTINAIDELWATEIDGPDVIEEGESVFYDIQAGGDMEIKFEWTCDRLDLVQMIAVHTSQTQVTGIAVIVDTTVEIKVTIDSPNFDPITRSKIVTITDTSPPGWARTWDASLVTLCSGIAVDKLGDIYITGGFDGTVDFDPGPGVHEIDTEQTDAFLSKFDNTGDFLWVQTWGGEQYHLAGGAGVAVADSGDVYITGLFEGTIDLDPGPGTVLFTSSGVYDIFLCKYDAEGNFQWGCAWGGDGLNYWDGGYAVAIDASGDVYVTGTFTGVCDFDPGPGVAEYSSYTGGVTWYNAAIFLTSFTSDGEFQWARVWGGDNENDEDWGHGIGISSMGDVFVVGSFYGTADFDPGPGVDEHTAHDNYAYDTSDAFLTSFGPDGDYLWSVSWGGDDGDYALDIAMDDSDNIYLTGFFSGPVDFDPGPDVDEREADSDFAGFLTKYASSGQYLWTKAWGQGEEDWPEYYVASYAVDISGSDSVYVTGWYSGTVDFDPGPDQEIHESYNSSYYDMVFDDVYISKFDTSGNFQWARVFGNKGYDIGYAIAADESGNAFAMGSFEGTVDFDPGTGEDLHQAENSFNIFLTKFPPDGDW